MQMFLVIQRRRSGKPLLVKVGWKVRPKQPAFVKASAALASCRRKMSIAVSLGVYLLTDLTVQWVQGEGADMGPSREGCTMCCNKSCSINLVP